VAVGDPVLVLPAGRPTRVRAIRLGDALLDRAWAGQSAALALEDDLDVSRGDLLAAQDRPPAVVRDLEATLCWLGGASAEQGGRYLLRHGPRETRAVLRDIAGRLDLATLEHRPCGRLGMNDIARVSLKLQGPVAVDAYWNHPGTGAFILIDEATNATVAAGMVAA
jgi:sulfate adenylyltransferase subunit 1